jgi:hypothetical protein
LIDRHVKIDQVPLAAVDAEASHRHRRRR